MNLNIPQTLRNRRFRAIGLSLGLSPYTVDRWIECGLSAVVIHYGTEQANVRFADPIEDFGGREYAAASVRDAEFFVREFNRRSESVHTEGGGGHEW